MADTLFSQSDTRQHVQRLRQRYINLPSLPNVDANEPGYLRMIGDQNHTIIAARSVDYK